VKAIAISRSLFPRQLAFVLLASAIAIPALAQQGQPTTDSQSTPPATVEQQPSPIAPPSVSVNAPKEGFWGRVNPFARKKWVNNRVEPLKGQLNELDEVNAKNGRDIKDVDGRSQAGIRRAQSTADAANQTASDAGSLAQRANATAQGANGHVDQLNTTVYRPGPVSPGKSARRSVSPWPADSVGCGPQAIGRLRRQPGRSSRIRAGIEGHSPQASTAGIQNSGRLAEAVKRYLVTEDQIPVYRLHTVALGNAPAAGSEETKPAKSSSVSIRLMENSLAAQEVASP
jgi:hypothetical protein